MLLWGIAVLVVVTVLVHFYVRSLAEKVNGLPDTYALPELRAEPQGDEVFITASDGTRIRAVSAGSGPTVVFAHGFMFTLQEWNVVWKMLLAKGYRLIAFDQRGHGKTTIGSDGIGSRQMASDYEAVLAHFDVKDGILVGHSMGGFLTQAFLLNHPEAAKKHLKGAILFAALVGNVTKDAPQNRVQIPLIKYGIIKRVMQSPVYGTMFATSLMGDHPTPALIRTTLDVMLAQNTPPLIPILQAMVAEDFTPRLGEISLPVVVICGSNDKTTPKWHSEVLGKSIPNARNVWVEGKGHVLNWEAPEVLVDAVVSLS
ncbi:MAG: alpha/beta hydrolase [Chloroflexi bacterium]|nr:alpha/beta hydrolase [Chloroflexota bacterium]